MMNIFSISTLSIADLYGGKICAALDRQHPRDLFDILVLFENEGITADIRKAFIIYLASHDRPMQEILNPQRLDMREIFLREFSGMTDKIIKYEELEITRERLITEIIGSLSQSEKEFLISMKLGTPQWDQLGIEGIEILPALRWKLINIQKMEKSKRDLMVEKLKTVLKI